ncbi:hypothetical protein OG689_44190 [Kitasatospora sp. NBC_00240]|uniref:hypothetical protein n=1 Tax=Kitasatospora sp. NBC_00240 TaxID=2903567 RepID=UPI00225A4E6A|nr:hypothetical protein [Kitasatospora sp. NBC_00240]MCX5216138.1 hypothetical protein [Kitasatospora sp. NBC_00240]
MPWSISRDNRLAELRQLLHDRSATLANLTPGSAAHTGLQTECDAIYAEIKQLEGSTGCSPAVLIAITVLVLLVVLTAR